MKMTETEIDGLTHRCSNPECHVPTFVATLKLKREEQATYVERWSDSYRTLEAVDQKDSS